MPGRKPATILFVCSGNTCRSPMAATLFNARAGLDPAWLAESAGLAAAEGARASYGATFAMQEWGFDLSGHRSRLLSPALVKRADLIVGLAAAHSSAIIGRYPKAEPKTLSLGGFLPEFPEGIADPFGGGLDDYRRARDEIDRALTGFVEFLQTYF